MSSEQWLPVRCWTGYEVSNTGQIRSYRRQGKAFTSLANEPKMRKPVFDKNGYARVMLSANGFRKLRGIHQMVAEAFLADSWFEGAIVRHKDDNPSNNHVSNLEWGTPADNTKDRMRNKGLGVSRSADEVREIRRLYEMGFQQREIARVFRTTQAYVSQLVTGKQRKDVA